jgi:hypothetical protein
VPFDYHCEDEDAAELAALSMLLVASGVHLTDYVNGTLAGDARVVVQDALSALRGAAKAACPHGVAPGIEAAMVSWRGRLQQVRGDPVRDPQGVAVADELLASSAAAARLDALQAIVEVVEEQSAALYDGSWPGVVVSVGTCGKHPRGERDPYGISPVMKVTKAGVATVELSIHVASFGPEALAAVAGALVHECVCHVAAQPLAPADNESVFAEGFMDWAASYYLQAWAVGLPGELAVMARIHDERHRGILIDGSSPAAIARKSGRRAAERLAHALQRYHGVAAAKAQAQVARFATWLNTADVRRVKKDAWASIVSARPMQPLTDVELRCLAGLEPPEAIF